MTKQPIKKRSQSSRQSPCRCSDRPIHTLMNPKKNQQKLEAKIYVQMTDMVKTKQIETNKQKPPRYPYYLTSRQKTKNVQRRH